MNDDPPVLGRRVTRELPAMEPPPLAPGTPPEPGQRVTRELPAAAPAPVPEQILLILRAPREQGETARSALARKERELAGLLETLAPAHAAELFARLSRPWRGDPVAACFACLDPARRGRLLALLCAPRRARRRAARRWGA